MKKHCRGCSHPTICDSHGCGRDEAQAERDDGIPDLPMPSDLRQPFFLPLAPLGFKDLHVEPRRGYVSWRAIDVKTGLVVRCAALKELFRWIAKQLPKMLAKRNFQ